MSNFVGRSVGIRDLYLLCDTVITHANRYVYAIYLYSVHQCRSLRECLYGVGGRQGAVTTVDYRWTRYATRLWARSGVPSDTSPVDTASCY